MENITVGLEVGSKIPIVKIGREILDSSWHLIQRNEIDCTVRTFNLKF